MWVLKLVSQIPFKHHPCVARDICSEKGHPFPARFLDIDVFRFRGLPIETIWAVLCVRGILSAINFSPKTLGLVFGPKGEQGSKRTPAGT